MNKHPRKVSDVDQLAHLDALLDNVDTDPPGSDPDSLATTVRLLRVATPIPDPAFVERLGQQLRFRRVVRPRQQRFLRWVGVLAAALLTIMLALVLSPQTRLAAAAAIEGAQRAWLRITSGPDGLVRLNPPPPFTARQFRPTPPDFALVGNRYAPLAHGVVGWSATVARNTAGLAPDPVVQEAVERNRSPESHLVLAYRSSHGDYLFLYQRAVEAGEALPPGELREVNTAPATLRVEGERHVLTWMQGDTWTELESTLDEAQTLMLASTLAPLDAATAAGINSPLSPSNNAPSSWNEPAWCDPEEQPPQPLLGQVAGERLQGSIWLTFEPVGEREEVNPSLGFNVPDRNVVLDAAMTALENPRQPLVKLPYLSVGRGTYDVTAGCLRAAEVPGYLIIEVWEQEVRIGYGGSGDQRRAEALGALKKLRAP